MAQEKNEFSSLSWRIYDFFDFTEKYIFPWVISCLIFLAITTTFWVFWPDFNDRNTIYSYSVIERNCHSKECKLEFPHPTMYVIDRYNRGVNFKTLIETTGSSEIAGYKNCEIIDKKNWACGYPIKMDEGIMSVAPNAKDILAQDGATLQYIPKWKWKLKKIENILRKIPKI